MSARFKEARVGLRPASSDTVPVIGPSSEMPGLFYATGHYRNGILLAPLTAVMLADGIIDGRWHRTARRDQPGPLPRPRRRFARRLERRATRERSYLEDRMPRLNDAEIEQGPAPLTGWKRDAHLIRKQYLPLVSRRARVSREARIRLRSGRSSP